MTTSKRRRPLPGRGLLAFLPFAVLVLPLAAFIAGPIGAGPFTLLALVIILGTGTVGVASLRVRGAGVRLAAAGATLAAGFLLGAATYFWSFAIVSALVGAATGISVRTGRLGRAFAMQAIGVTAVAGGAIVFATAASGAFAGGCVATTCLILGLFLPSQPHPGENPGVLAAVLRSSLPIAALSAATLFAFAFVGSTSPRSSWFGDLTWHGPRSSNQVALTFDDGPNGETTLQVASILEEAGARGTFFEVGKAVVQQPEISKALVERGHIVADHSFSHSELGFLRAGYPELKTTQAAIASAAGICPALYRPPHGSHTPFLSRTMSNNGLRIITWDVSATDWTETDADRLARNIVARAKPGSIILLHDGLDGNIGEDRSVLIAALPAILAGLKAKGLTPVGLDTLLGVQPYQALDHCLGTQPS